MSAWLSTITSADISSPLVPSFSPVFSSHRSSAYQSFLPSVCGTCCARASLSIMVPSLCTYHLVSAASGFYVTDHHWGLSPDELLEFCCFIQVGGSLLTSPRSPCFLLVKSQGAGWTPPYIVMCFLVLTSVASTSPCFYTNYISDHWQGIGVNVDCSNDCKHCCELLWVFF